MLGGLNMAELKITPIMWKHNQSLERTNENVIRFAVDGNLPNGIAAYIASDGGEWLFETAGNGSEPVESEARFSSAPEAVAALEVRLSNRPSA